MSLSVRHLADRIFRKSSILGQILKLIENPQSVLMAVKCNIRIIESSPIANDWHINASESNGEKSTQILEKLIK
jgi:hypothetical protein